MRRSDLEPYDAGRRDYEIALARLETAVGDDPELRGAVTAADRQARSWMGLARAALTRRR